MSILVAVRDIAITCNGFFRLYCTLFLHLLSFLKDKHRYILLIITVPIRAAKSAVVLFVSTTVDSGIRVVSILDPSFDLYFSGTDELLLIVINNLIDMDQLTCYANTFILVQLKGTVIILLILMELATSSFYIHNRCPCIF